MKKVLLIILALALVMGLYACGDPAGETPTTPGTPPVSDSPSSDIPGTEPPQSPAPTDTVPPSDPVTSEPPSTFTAPEGTVLCGMRLDGMTREEAVAALRSKAEGLTFSLEVDGKTVTLTGQGVGLTLDEAKLDAYWAALEQSESFGDPLFTLTGSYLESAIAKELEFSAKNPAVTFSKTQGKFIVTHGSSGMDYDIPTIANQASVALCSLKSSCAVAAQGTVLNPTVSNSDPRLEAAAEAANRYLPIQLAYIFTPDGENSATETLTAERISTLVGISADYTVSISRTAVDQYASALVNNYSDVARSGAFITTAGGTAPLEVKYYGHQVDGQALADDIYNCLTTGISGTREAPYVSAERAALPYGGSYVEVDLTNQNLWVYKNGVCVVSTPIVSGCVANGDHTPTGVFSIYKKVEDCWLVGPTWYDHVDYWMAFYGAYGLHDASWRSEFGGELYIYEGSHGCPNLPVEIAGEVYHNVSVGTPVIIHGGLTEPVDLTQEIIGSTTYNLFSIGESFTLDAAPKYEGAELTYTSSNPAVATVTADGVVTIQGSGNAVITVSAAPFTNHTGAELAVKINVFLPCDPENHMYGDWVEVFPGTCDTLGLEERTCSICGNVETRESSSYHHTFHVHEDGSEWIVTDAPNCLHPGVETRTCTLCGLTEQREIPATGHDFSGNRFMCRNGCGSLNPLYPLPGTPGMQ